MLEADFKLRLAFNKLKSIIKLLNVLQGESYQATGNHAFIQ